MPTRMSAAEYLSKAIDMSEKNQREIPEEVGYARPNVISMMKQGLTKIPVDKVPAFAKALGLDPAHFMRLVLREYQPEAWDAIERAVGEVLTEREKKWVKLLRDADPMAEIELDTAAQVAVTDTLKSLVH